MLIRIRNSNLQGGLNSNYREQFGGVGDYCMIDTPGGRIPPKIILQPVDFHAYVFSCIRKDIGRD